MIAGDGKTDDAPLKADGETLSWLEIGGARAELRKFIEFAELDTETIENRNKYTSLCATFMYGFKRAVERMDMLSRIDDEEEREKLTGAYVALVMQEYKGFAAVCSGEAKAAKEQA